MDFAFNLSFLMDSHTVLDVALANFDTLCHIDTYKNLPADLLSDHYIIVFRIKQTICRYAKTNTVKFDYNHANWDDINQFLHQI